MKLNGKKYNKSYISYEDIKNGAEITFNLDNKPNKKWANDKNSLPSSLTKKGEIPKPMEDLIASNVKIENSIPNIDSKFDCVFSPNDNVGNLFDNNSLSETSVKKVYYYFNKPKIIKIYTITSGNKENSLMSFKLLGSNDGEKWNLIDSRTNEIFKWKRYTRPFVIETNKAIEYKFYKLEFDSINDVAEIEFIG